MPLYSSKRDGPPHALRFKATVTIDGYTYESPEFFNTLKKAEHAAAKVALMSLLQDDFQEASYINICLHLLVFCFYSLIHYICFSGGLRLLQECFARVSPERTVLHSIV